MIGLASDAIKRTVVPTATGKSKVKTKQPRVIAAQAAALAMINSFYTMGKQPGDSGIRLRRSGVHMKPYGVRTKGYNEKHGNGARIGYYDKPKS